MLTLHGEYFGHYLAIRLLAEKIIVLAELRTRYHTYIRTTAHACVNVCYEYPNPAHGTEPM